MSNQKVTYEFPTEAATLFEGLLHNILAPPEPPNGKAAPAGPRSGFVITGNRQNFRDKEYQTEVDTATADFADILGGDSPAHVVQARRVDLVRNGYTPTPVSGKAAVLKGWSKQQPDEWEARRWTQTHAHAQNTGIVLGGDLVAIDIDVLDARLVEDLLSDALKLGEGKPLVRVGQAPKTLLLYRTDLPLSKRTTGKYRRAEGEKEQGVEVLAAGQQFVADGIHPDTGRPYEWIGPTPLDLPLRELPLINAERLDAFLRKADAALKQTGWRQTKAAADEAKPDLFADILGGTAKRDQIPAAECRTILADLPTEWCESRDKWIRAGMALHHNFEGDSEGLALWDEWSRKSAKYDRDAIRRDWRSFKDKANAVTMGTLVEAAAEARRDRELDACLDDLDEPDPDFDGILGPSPANAIKPKGLQFFTPAQCADLPSRGYVIKGFIAPRDVACIFGAPGAGKSMIAPFLGYAVAQGKEAFGMRTKPGKVFYLPMEDESGMRQRVRALREQHGEADEFFVVSGCNLSTEDGEKELRLAIREQRPSLIIIDTLAAAFPGLEENGSESMSKVVALGRRLAKWGAAVVFIHHSTKARDGTPRGHSVFDGALDVSMELQAADEQGIVRGKLRKNRNGTCDKDVAFRIRSHEFGIDEDGDPITAGYCEPCQPGSVPKAVKLSVPQREALNTLRDMGGIEAHVPLEEWRSRCKQNPRISASDNPDTVRKAVQRAFEGLFRSGLVFRQGDMVRLETTEDLDLDTLDDLDGED